MIGHCLTAAGSIESIAAVLQLHHQFVHPNLNCEDLHPEITGLVCESRIPKKSVNTKLKKVIKANFGFGDVNACLVLSQYDSTKLGGFKNLRGLEAIPHSLLVNGEYAALSPFPQSIIIFNPSKIHHHGKNSHLHGL